MIAQLLGHRHVGTTDRCTHIRVDSTQPTVELRWTDWMGGA